jgi:hypothetical protein
LVGTAASDVNPVLWDDFYTYTPTDSYTASWGSIVLHCRNTAKTSSTPIACAKLVEVSDTTTGGPSVASSTSGSGLAGLATSNLASNYYAILPGGGYFTMDIDTNGVASYAWDFNLTAGNPKVTASDVTKGLSCKI